MLAHAPTNQLLEAALSYAALGWSIFPVFEPVEIGKCACGLEDCSKAKHPRTEHGFLNGSTDAFQLERWWREWPHANIGVLAGQRTGFILLDIDPKHGGDLELRKLEREHGDLRGTITVATGGGGMHMLYRYPKGLDVRNSTSKVAPGIDVRGNGGYFIAPPSMHIDGKFYQWVFAPGKIEMQELPDWLLDFFKQQQDTRVAQPPKLAAPSGRTHSIEDKIKRCTAYVARIDGAAEGTRNDTFYRNVCHACHGFDLDDADFWPIALEWNARCVPEGMSEKELRITLDKFNRADNYPRGWLLDKDSESFKRWKAERERFHPDTRVILDSPDPGEMPDDLDDRFGPWTVGTLLTPPVVDLVEHAKKKSERSRAAGNGEDPPADKPPGIGELYATNSGLDGFPKTELGNAQRIHRDHGDSIRHAPQSGQWYIWSDTHWQIDDTLAIAELVQFTARGMARCELDGETENERKDWRKWCKLSEGKQNMTNSLALAGAMTDLKLSPDRLDADDLLVNTPSGVVDVRNPMLPLQAHAREQYHSRITHAHYVRDAECPQWMAFLNEIFAQDLEMVSFIQRAVGYSMTGCCGEQCLFFLYGTGANGKSTMLNVLRTIANTYADHTPFDTFMEQESDKVRNDLARLHGVRFVSTTEPKPGKRIDEALIKQLTGEDPVTARFLRKEFFTYKPRFKIWISANFKPRIRGTDDGIWRRIRMIPFKVQIPPERRDLQLQRKLETEGPGILAWALEGAHDWVTGGLRPPPAVIEATSEYRVENDAIGLFLSECMTGAAPSGKLYECPSAKLYASYCAWCDEINERPMSNRTFSQQLLAKGYEIEKRKHGRIVLGVGLSSELDDHAPYQRGLAYRDGPDD